MCIGKYPRRVVMLDTLFPEIIAHVILHVPEKVSLLEVAVCNRALFSVMTARPVLCALAAALPANVEEMPDVIFGAMLRQLDTLELEIETVRRVATAYRHTRTERGEALLARLAHTLCGSQVIALAAARPVCAPVANRIGEFDPVVVYNQCHRKRPESAARVLLGCSSPMARRVAMLRPWVVNRRYRCLTVLAREGDDTMRRTVVASLRDHRKLTPATCRFALQMLGAEMGVSATLAVVRVLLGAPRMLVDALVHWHTQTTGVRDAVVGLVAARATNKFFMQVLAAVHRGVLCDLFSEIAFSALVRPRCQPIASKVLIRTGLPR